MPAQWRRGVYDKVEYIVVERDGVKDEGQFGVEQPTATVDRILRRSEARRQVPTPTNMAYESDSGSDDENHHPATRKAVTTPTLAMPSASATLMVTMTLSVTQPTQGALANTNPSETVVVALTPSTGSDQERDGRVSQTTEHLLIAAGSIGATIIIVMILLVIYTMRKRGLSFADVIQQGKQQMRRTGPPPPPKYGFDGKRSFDDESSYGKNDSVYAPPPAAIKARSGSFATQTPLQTLGQSDSFNKQGLERKNSVNKSFFDDTLSRSNSNPHHRNISATPSSPLLPVQGKRLSASTRNTRSLVGDEEALRYSDPTTPQQMSNAPLPAPPSFRQFLSNRPSISQRPGIGGGMMSRFSWTNSNAPQTPHDASRDTVTQPITGRDSFMTTRSSVPRFRTVDSWVNQQSNRVEEQRLKQQFRMTQSTIYSDDDVPEMPKIPETPAAGVKRNGSGLKKNESTKSGLVGRDIKHQRHDTTTTVLTAPIFKAHPGTEVRFSMRSAVASEILDMGRKNAAL
ncbi:hypothetical protein EJ02DRAFT_399755 [Clathrospora elynae]|uniref:Uncharacterized protein n=1 Tax=Clathrospora elynae TaxID=706981 RepID=A0A6A5SYY4_9PLEO|nr:hypothetical protein EJ02DRAFT_399755 [Clathrospora elynae]